MLGTAGKWIDILANGVVGYGGVGSTREDIEHEVEADGRDGRGGGEGERIGTGSDVECRG